MATFISLVNFTDQGIRNIKESPDRYEAFAAGAEKAGVTVKAVLYTVGQYVMVLIVEGSGPAAVAALLTVGSLGNVRSQTLRGFSVDEMRKIIASIP
mgnify:FL=1